MVLQKTLFKVIINHQLWLIRAHQFPVAFLNLVSCLDKHGTNSDNPIAYTHLDIAGCYGKVPNNWGLGEVTGNPIVAIASSFLK